MAQAEEEEENEEEGPKGEAAGVEQEKLRRGRAAAQLVGSHGSASELSF